MLDRLQAFVDLNLQKSRACMICYTYSISYATSFNQETPYFIYKTKNKE